MVLINIQIVIGMKSTFCVISCPNRSIHLGCNKTPHNSGTDNFEL